MQYIENVNLKNTLLKYDERTLRDIWIFVSTVHKSHICYNLWDERNIILEILHREWLFWEDRNKIISWLCNVLFSNYLYDEKWNFIYIKTKSWINCLLFNQIITYLENFEFKTIIIKELYKVLKKKNLCYIFSIYFLFFFFLNKIYEDTMFYHYSVNVNLINIKQLNFILKKSLKCIWKENFSFQISNYNSIIIWSWLKIYDNVNQISEFISEDISWTLWDLFNCNDWIDIRIMKNIYKIIKKLWLLNTLWPWLMKSKIQLGKISYFKLLKYSDAWKFVF